MSNTPLCYECNKEAETQSFNGYKFIVCLGCNYELDRTGMPIRPITDKEIDLNDNKYPRGDW